MEPTVFTIILILAIPAALAFGLYGLMKKAVKDALREYEDEKTR